MASYCPKCNGKLGITNLGANCPHCGVNLLYYDIERRLLADADAAEAESALFSKKLARVKAAYVGSPLAIARIVLSVLPIAALFLPLVKGSIEGPFIDKSFSVGMIQIYNVISRLDFDALFKFFDSNILGSAFVDYFVSIIAIVLTALSSLLGLILLFLACSRLGKIRSIFFPAFGLTALIVSMFMFTRFSSGFSAVLPATFTASFAFGAYVLLGTLAALLILNIVICIVGIPIVYKEKFVGGIPADRYFEAVAAGEDIEAIRREIAQEKKAKEEAEKANAQASEEVKEEKQQESEPAKA
jgi:signal transduction histidine kinase